MKRLALMVLLLSAAMPACQAKDGAKDGGAATVADKPVVESQHPSLRDEIFERAKKPKGGKESTKLDLLNELMQKGAEEAGVIKDYGKPRIVPKGGKPEIIIKGDQIFINGKSVAISQPINEWKKVLPKTAVCRERVRVTCKWESLGIEVSTQSISNTAIYDFTIYFNLEPPDPYAGLVTHRPDGTPVAPKKDYRPKHPFPGYFELDGYGIDAKTEFWEIRASVDPERELRCGVRDCSHPHGGFSDKASLYLRLNRANEYGNLYEFTISGMEEAVPKSSAPK